MVGWKQFKAYLTGDRKVGEVPGSTLPHFPRGESGGYGTVLPQDCQQGDSEASARKELSYRRFGEERQVCIQAKEELVRRAGTLNDENLKTFYKLAGEFCRYLFENTPAPDFLESLGHIREYERADSPKAIVGRVLKTLSTDNVAGNETPEYVAKVLESLKGVLRDVGEARSFGREDPNVRNKVENLNIYTAPLMAKTIELEWMLVNKKGKPRYTPGDVVFVVQVLPEIIGKNNSMISMISSASSGRCLPVFGSI